MSSGKNVEKMYKQTRALVVLARNDGMTLGDIAELCKVSQPSVTKWGKGDSLATIANIQPLIDKYGSLLPQASRNYWSPWPVDTQCTSDDYREESGPSAFVRYHYRVEGHVILSFACSGPPNSPYDRIEGLPMKKVVVHHQGGGLFRMVELCRLFKSSEKPGGESYVLGIPVRQRPWVMERIHDLVSAADLVQQLDEFADQWITQRIDAFDLPMKARKALQDNGFPVNDVEIYPASQGR